MHKFKKKKKTVLILAAGASVAAISVGAYAYWTAGGSGTGSAATGTSQDITAVQTSTVSAMGPGVAAQTLSGTFLNENDGPVYVSTVTASIASVVKADGAAGGTCDASDYTLANAVMTVNAEASADDTTTWSGATIMFNNKAGTNQDACKLATVNLAYVIA
jgi:hypothetical protein